MWGWHSSHLVHPHVQGVLRLLVNGELDLGRGELQRPTIGPASPQDLCGVERQSNGEGIGGGGEGIGLLPPLSHLCDPVERAEADGEVVVERGVVHPGLGVGVRQGSRTACTACVGDMCG